MERKTLNLKYYAVKRFGRPWGGDTVIKPLYEVEFSVSGGIVPYVELLLSMTANEVGRHAHLPPLESCRKERFPWAPCTQSGGFGSGISEYPNGRLKPDYADAILAAIKCGIKVESYEIAPEWEE